jgi:hypothetical protein
MNNLIVSEDIPCGGYERASKSTREARTVVMGFEPNLGAAELQFHSRSSFTSLKNTKTSVPVALSVVYTTIATLTALGHCHRI